MNTSVRSDARERNSIMPNRHLAYVSDETHGKAERAHVRRACGAGGASFAKKKPDLARQGSDLSPQVVDWVGGRTSLRKVSCRVPLAQGKVTARALSS